MSTRRRTTGRRWARGTVAAVAVVGLSASLAACGGGADPEESLTIEATETGASPSEALASAAQATAAVESGRMRATVSYSFDVDGQTGTADMVMEGVFTDQGRRTEISMDMGDYLQQLANQLDPGGASEMPGSMAVRMVVDGTRMYQKFEIEPAEPGMEYWYVTDMEEMGLDTSQMENPAGFGGPTSYLESLKGAGADVIDAGRTEIDGIPVTRYEGTIDSQAAIEKADPEKRSQLRSMLRESGMGGTMPFVAYVDDDGVLRRQEMTMSMDMGLAQMTATTTVDYYDFGADVTVTVPPADLVRDVSELTGLGA